MIAETDAAASVPARLRAPRAAALAGILFALLLATSLVLLRRAVPADPLEAGAWLQTRTDLVVLGLNLVPFAGLGEREDRFLATVFLGSGILFLAMLFVSAAVAGGLIIAAAAEPDGFLGSAAFAFARATTYEIMNVYAIKMAGVFMILTSTLALRTGFLARWIAVLGYALALLSLFSGRYIAWSPMVFPSWVLLISLYILIDNLRRPSPTTGP